MGGSKRPTKTKRAGHVVGKISLTRKGYGFVEAQDGDFYVSARDLNGAMHGDLVTLRPETRRGRQGKSGVVVRVLERAVTQVVGRFERHGAIGIVIPGDRRIRNDVFIAASALGEARTGDIVVARLTAYPTRTTAAQGVVEEVVGREDDPGIRIEVIIREHGLRTEFDARVEEQAAGIELDVASALTSEPARRAA